MQIIILKNFLFIINLSKAYQTFKNLDPLVELPFYEQLDVIKTGRAFKGYAMSYKVEIIEKKKKDPIVQYKQVN